MEANKANYMPSKISSVYPDQTEIAILSHLVPL